MEAAVPDRVAAFYSSAELLLGQIDFCCMHALVFFNVHMCLDSTKPNAIILTHHCWYDWKALE